MNWYQLVNLAGRVDSAVLLDWMVRHLNARSPFADDLRLVRGREAPVQYESVTEAFGIRRLRDPADFD